MRASALLSHPSPPPVWPFGAVGGPTPSPTQGANKNLIFFITADQTYHLNLNPTGSADFEFGPDGGAAQAFTGVSVSLASASWQTLELSRAGGALSAQLDGVTIFSADASLGGRAVTSVGWIPSNNRVLIRTLVAAVIANAAASVDAGPRFDCPESLGSRVPGRGWGAGALAGGGGGSQSALPRHLLPSEADP